MPFARTPLPIPNSLNNGQLPTSEHFWNSIYFDELQTPIISRMEHKCLSHGAENSEFADARLAIGISLKFPCSAPTALSDPRA
jgi:hypothetical protein